MSRFKIKYDILELIKKCCVNRKILYPIYILENRSNFLTEQLRYVHCLVKNKLPFVKLFVFVFLTSVIQRYYKLFQYAFDNFKSF